jgi:DNA repair exonuclease SbcCD nuclease subunit
MAIVPMQHSTGKSLTTVKKQRRPAGASGWNSGREGLVTWLHISDWHQGEPDTDRRILLQGMLEDIRARSSFASELSEIDLVIFSGDVAFSGKSTEYAAAESELIEPIRQLLGGKARFVFAPGNHDLEWDKIGSIPSEWEGLLSSNATDRHKQVGDLLYDKKKSPMMLSPFQNFYQFSQKNGWSYEGEPVHSVIVEQARPSTPPSAARVIQLARNATLSALHTGTMARSQ